MMKWKVIVILIGVIVNAALIGCTSTAVFTSLDINNAGKHQTLKGKLTKPDGDGPFPAVVLLHGCGGMQDRDYGWVGKLKSWGFVTLMVDSFGPRGESKFLRLGSIVHLIDALKMPMGQRCILRVFPS